MQESAAGTGSSEKLIHPEAASRKQKDTAQSPVSQALRSEEQAINQESRFVI
jgi:hypothetical protein